MNRYLIIVFVFFLTVFLGACSKAPETLQNNWPQFRGYHASGLNTRKATPTEWNVETGKNVLWRTPIAGLAHSAPIIWGDRVYMTTAVGPGEAELKIGRYGAIAAAEDQGHHEWRLLAMDRQSGEILFDKLAYEGIPRSLRHTKGTHCNSTPATNGDYLVAYLGSEGLFCFDMEGELLWQKDLGDMDAGYFKVKTAEWGFASSPVIHDGKVIVQCDVQEDAFLAVYNLEDGEEVWRTPRSDVPTWSTPAVVDDKHKS